MGKRTVEAVVAVVKIIYNKNVSVLTGSFLRGIREDISTVLSMSANNNGKWVFNVVKHSKDGTITV